MNYLFLDFETYWDSKEYTLKKMSVFEYIKDQRFAVHGAAVCVGGQEAVWLSGSRLDAFLARVPWHRTRLVCFNSAFDSAILSYVYGYRPMLDIDVMGMARAMLGNALPRFNLDTVARHFGLEGKTRAGDFNLTDGVRHLSDGMHDRLGEYCCADVEMTAEIFRKLEPRFPASQYRVLDWTIKMMTAPALRLDAEVLQRAHDDEVRRKDDIINKLKVSKTALQSNEKFAELLAHALRPYDDKPPTKISSRTGELTYAFSKQDEKFVDLLDHPDEVVRTLVSARLETKGSLMETRARSMLKAAQLADGLAPVGLNYSGAVTTHRLSGNANGAIPNPQNLSRGSLLRKAIVPPAGFRIVAMDLSQIELRIGAMLVGQHDIIEQLRTGGDTYASFAAHVYGRPIVKGVDIEERNVGKVTVLSCQYKSGAGALRRMLMVQAGLRKDPEFCSIVINTYRSVYPEYPLAWHRLRELLTLWAKGHTGDEVRTLDFPETVRIRRGRIILPSGLELKYPDVRYEMFKDRYQFTFASKNRLKSVDGRQMVHEGILIENICQSLAREVMDHITVTIAREEKLWPSLQVHDEIVYVVPESGADRFVRSILTIANRSIPWWPELPVTAEGGHGPNYLDCPKDKLR